VVKDLSNAAKRHLVGFQTAATISRGQLLSENRGSLSPEIDSLQLLHPDVEDTQFILTVEPQRRAA
jgi:hypothetical protein